MKHSNILIISEAFDKISTAIKFCKSNRLIPFLITMLYESKIAAGTKDYTLAYSSEDFASAESFVKINKINQSIVIVTWKEDLDGEER